MRGHRLFYSVNEDKSSAVAGVMENNADENYSCRCCFSFIHLLFSMLLPEIETPKRRQVES
jgi:hypothetical protein